MTADERTAILRLAYEWARAAWDHNLADEADARRALEKYLRAMEATC